MDNESAIFNAACRGKVTNFKRLLSKETELEVCNSKGISLLQHVVISGSDETAVIAMGNFSGNDIPRNSYFGTLLNCACSSGRPQTVEELLKRAPQESLSTYLNYKCGTGTPLYSASYGRFSVIIEALLEAGASIDLVGGELGSPLHVACALGRMDATRLLLKRGAKLDSAKEDGTIVSAMQAASPFKNVQALLRKFQEGGVEALDDFDEKKLGRGCRIGVKRKIEELSEIGEGQSEVVKRRMVIRQHEPARLHP